MRKDHRKDQLRQLLEKEVQAALKSKCYKRSFNLGSFCHDVDGDILKLDPIINPKLQIKIHDGSIADLDELLGHGWDVREVEEGQNVFVTDLKLAVSLDCIVGSIKTAIFRGTVVFKETSVESFSSMSHLPDSCSPLFTFYCFI